MLTRQESHDFKSLNSQALKISEIIVKRLFPNGKTLGNEFKVGSLQGEPGDSLSINLSTGVWADFAADSGGADLISLYAAVYNVSQGKAAEMLKRDWGFESKATVQKKEEAKSQSSWTPIIPVPESCTKPSFYHYKYKKASKYWEYRDRDLNLLFYTCRFDTEDGKQVLPYSYCEDGSTRRWHFKGAPVPRPLYGLDRISDGKKILIVEGEKCADEALELDIDYIPISWAGGSKSAKHADWSVLAGKTVKIWADADEPGLRAAREIKEILKKCGAVQVDILKNPANVKQGWDVVDAIEEGFDAKDFIENGEILKDDAEQDDAFIPEEQKADQDWLEEYNKKYAIIRMGGKIKVLIEENGELDFLSVEGFKEWTINESLVSKDAQAGTEKRHKKSALWLKHPKRRTYTGIVFEPTASGEDKKYNLWKGFSCSPKPGDCSIFLDHLKTNVCSGNEKHYNWLLAWLANMFQDPCNKPGIALVLRGERGTGKTKFGEIIGSLIAKHYKIISKAAHLTGQFNAQLENTLLLQVEEAFWAGDKNAEGVLKDLITSDALFIERKGLDPYTTKNYIRLLITSNEDWVIPAGPDERRFAVFDVAGHCKQDHNYFAEMDKQIQNGGREALLYELMNLDISNFNLWDIPKTSALFKQKLASLPVIEQWWLDCLVKGQNTNLVGWEAEPMIEEVYKSYTDYVEKIIGLRRKASLISFSMNIKKLMPDGFFKNRNSITKIDGTRASTYMFPPLEECREFMSNYVDFNINWGEL